MSWQCTEACQYSRKPQSGTEKQQKETSKTNSHNALCYKLFSLLQMAERNENAKFCSGTVEDRAFHSYLWFSTTLWDLPQQFKLRHDLELLGSGKILILVNSEGHERAAITVLCTLINLFNLSLWITWILEGVLQRLLIVTC